MQNSLFQRNVPGSTEILNASCVGLAGCGGLGSNAAVALTRAGIGHLILADLDRVELSNLNRQYFFQDDIGQYKVEALAKHLKAINPEVRIDANLNRILPDNISGIFEEASILIEAFDQAGQKKMLIDTWCALYPERPIIVGNGLSGLGRTNELGVVKSGTIHFCGDLSTESSSGLCSARVAIVANMQANVAIELLVARSADVSPHQGERGAASRREDR